MNMTTGHLLGTITGVIGMVLAGWLIYQLLGVMARRRNAVDEFAVADRARIYEGDQYAQLQREAAYSGRGLRVRPVDHLPTQAERTDMLSALRDDCPDCGIDHIGPCVPQSGPPAVDDYITGEIVAITDIPHDVTETDLTSVLLSRLDEFRTDWHWVGGQLHPPAALVDALPAEDWLNPGEPDWLRQLLEPELASA